jgi:hypothetical protein
VVLKHRSAHQLCSCGQTGEVHAVCMNARRRSAHQLFERGEAAEAFDTGQQVVLEEQAAQVGEVHEPERLDARQPVVAEKQHLQAWQQHVCLGLCIAAAFQGGSAAAGAAHALHRVSPCRRSFAGARRGRCVGAAAPCASSGVRGRGLEPSGGVHGRRRRAAKQRRHSGAEAVALEVEDAQARQQQHPAHGREPVPGE